MEEITIPKTIEKPNVLILKYLKKWFEKIALINVEDFPHDVAQKGRIENELWCESAAEKCLPQNVVEE